jgi:co-chaperonin GroES (HSP10)
MTKTYEDGGMRIGNETNVIVSEQETIRCLRDHIVVEVLAWEPSKILEVVYRGKPLRGRVLAVGPGRYPIKYDGPKGKRTKSWDSKHFLPTDVKVGDVVEFGGLEIRGYLFTTLRWGDKDCIVCREPDVAVVIEEMELSGPYDAQWTADEMDSFRRRA